MVKKQQTIPENLELWAAHYTPPKDAVKDFTRGGGFRGTAIDPMWLIRCATEQWGPMGDRWGLEVISEEYTFLEDHHVLHEARCMVYYPAPSGNTGRVPCVGQTWVVSETVDKKTGEARVLRDEEAPKKSRTDALAKGLSWLGFGAAVHMGAFDGNKYVDLPESATNARARAQAAVNETPRAVLEVAAAVWGREQAHVQKAAGTDNERDAKRWLVEVVENRADAIEVDPAARRVGDTARWVEDVINHVKLVAAEAAEEAP